MIMIMITIKVADTKLAMARRQSARTAKRTPTWEKARGMVNAPAPMIKLNTNTNPMREE